MPDLAASTRRLIELLGLVPHPEGGFFRETHRAALRLGGLPHGGERAASTSILYLLPADEFSPLHRVRSDEVWHHHDGAAVDLHLITPEGEHRVERLGRDMAHGERPQRVVPAGTWQAALPVPGAPHALCGCTVAPGFEYEDFEMPERAALVRDFPALSALIPRLTRA